MPVIDLICTQCSFVDSRFLPASEVGAAHPEAEFGKCSKCGSVSERNYSGISPSVGFKVPMLADYNKVTGEYSIPGHESDTIDEGYVRVQIRDMRTYEKLCRSVNAMEGERAQVRQQWERAVFDDRLKEQRQERKIQVEKAISQGGYWAEWKDEQGRDRREWRPVRGGMTRKLMDMSIKFSDKQIEARRQRMNSSVRSGANFHSRMLEHNESERSVVDGAGKKAVFFFGKKG